MRKFVTILIGDKPPKAKRLQEWVDLGKTGYRKEVVDPGNLNTVLQDLLGGAYIHTMTVMKGLKDE